MSGNPQGRLSKPWTREVHEPWWLGEPFTWTEADSDASHVRVRVNR
jgi:hypothetical protein